MPLIVERTAAAIKKQNPSLSRGQALAIAIKQLQRYRYLKKGTTQLTEKGKRLTSRMSKRKPTAPEILAKWGVTNSRKKRSRRKRRKKKNGKKKKKKS